MSLFLFFLRSLSFPRGFCQRSANKKRKRLTDQFQHAQLELRKGKEKKRSAACAFPRDGLWEKSSTYSPENEDQDGEIIIALPPLESYNPPSRKISQKEKQRPDAVLCPRLRLERGGAHGGWLFCAFARGSPVARRPGRKKRFEGSGNYSRNLQEARRRRAGWARGIVALTVLWLHRCCDDAGGSWTTAGSMHGWSRQSM